MAHFIHRLERALCGPQDAAPCVDARGPAAAAGLDRRVKLGGRNEFHAAAREPDTRMIGF